eukprot:1158062-Pelagomonas_calceolata.AAC.1
MNVCVLAAEIVNGYLASMGYKRVCCEKLAGLPRPYHVSGGAWTYMAAYDRQATFQKGCSRQCKKTCKAAIACIRPPRLRLACGAPLRLWGSLILIRPGQFGILWKVGSSGGSIVVVCRVLTPLRPGCQSGCASANAGRRTHSSANNAARRRCVQQAKLPVQQSMSNKVIRAARQAADASAAASATKLPTHTRSNKHTHNQYCT